MDDKHRSTEAYDAQLWAAVLGALGADSSVPSTRIGVAVINHVITLTGTVLNDVDRAAAVAAARRVSGVLAVVDDIVVADAKRSNNAEHTIAVAVEHELALVVEEVPTAQAIVRGRVVTLTGIADDHRQKYALVFAIRDIPGVAWVEDQLVNRERAVHDAERRAQGQAVS